MTYIQVLPGPIQRKSDFCQLQQLDDLCVNQPDGGQYGDGAVGTEMGREIRAVHVPVWTMYSRFSVETEDRSVGIDP